MSQVTAARTTGAPPAPAPDAPSGRRRDLRLARQARSNDAIRRWLEGTPGRLRIAAAISVLACVVFALLGASAFQARGDALAQARADAAQLIRVQQIATSLVSADSLFTNGFLANGKPAASRLPDYDAEIATASRSIAQASEANPQDAGQLATVNQELTVYTARVASARANSRNGFQVATGYLRQASDQLRGSTQQAQGVPAVPGMLPILNTLIDVNTQRVADAYSASGWATWRLVAAGLLAVAGLGFVQVQLARLTHRYLNLPLATASLAVIVMLIVGGLVMVSAQQKADDVKSGSYASTLALAKARIAAYSAKSQESIALIYLGTGGDYAGAEQLYQRYYAEAQADLQQVPNSDASLSQLAQWNAVHQKVYAAGSSDWTAATAQATLPATQSGTVNATFQALEGSTRQALATEATAVDQGLASRYGLLVITGWLTLIVGLIAAGAAWVGLSQRLEEYR